MFRPTGPGRSRSLLDRPGWVIYNFDIDGSRLKPEHRQYLQAKLGPPLRRGGSITLVGLASRTGTSAHNDGLSMRRAQNTLAFLRTAVPNGFVARQVVGFGERVAAEDGQRDRTEDEVMRSVVIYVASGPVPPVPPPVVPLPVLPVPAPTDGVLDTLTKILDCAGFAAGVLEIVAGAVLAAAFELTGALAGIGSAALALPAAWANADRLARFNGACRGYWDAMQDMANGYANPSLDSQPELLWPPVISPLPHRYADPESGLEQDRHFREGQVEGCLLAHRAILDMEARPLAHTVVVRGERREIRLSGRMLLRVLRHTYGSHGVADAIRADINRRLRASGRGEWPLHR